jgi:hypothetical protein
MIKPEDRGKDWEDANTTLTTGYQNAFEQAWYLTSSRIWPIVRSPRLGPFVLGAVLFAIIVSTVLLSPATDSHFIYTDF